MIAMKKRARNSSLKPEWREITFGTLMSTFTLFVFMSMETIFLPDIFLYRAVDWRACQWDNLSRRG
jgi:hypothetical protein